MRDAPTELASGPQLAAILGATTKQIACSPLSKDAWWGYKVDKPTSAQILLTGTLQQLQCL